MVTSAVLGAATGTGLALVVAMTIVVYRYYILRKRGKEWADLERFGDNRLSWWASGSSLGSYASAGTTGARPKKGPPLYAMPQKEFCVAKEKHVVQPLQSGYSSLPEASSPDCCPSSPGAMLTHQSRSLPSGPNQGPNHGPNHGANHGANQTTTSAASRIFRTPSISSQSSIESVARQGHRGSSPAIRTFTPEGRSADLSPSGGCTRTGCRSPSPHHQQRAASLDMRSLPASSPSHNAHHYPATGQTPTSPSQSSLVSLASSSSGTGGQQFSPAHHGRPRCLSPLLIPPKSPTPSDTGSGASANSSVSPGPVSPIGALQLDLYQRKDTTVFLGCCPPGSPPLGRLHFRLTFDFDKSDLHVHLIEAHNLTGSDQGGFNDPYVRLSLHPEVDGRKRQTAIHRNDPNPFFDEHFKFPVSQEELMDKTLLMQVFDYDRYSRNDVIGEVRMDLRDFEVTANVEVWAEITKNKKPPGEMQEVLFSLSYLPSAERLTVVLLKARNLFMPSNKDTVDPFAKVYLVVGGKRLKKKKTSARKASSNPVWNEAFTFSVPSTSLSQTCVEVCVVDQPSDVLGTCVVGPHEEGQEQEHWQDMTQNVRKSVAMWHCLR